MIDKPYKLLTLAVNDRIAEITVRRPKALNALNRQLLMELRTVFATLASDEPALTCVILTGAGDKAFVAGADVAEMAAMTPAAAYEFARLGQEVFLAIEQFPTPVLAAVNGFALGGGCELALCCDVIYAAESAKFGFPEVKLGLIPGFAGGVRLPRKIGLAAAAEWILTGAIYNAQSAKEVGLVRELHGTAELLPAVREVAKIMGSRGPLAVRAAKQVLVTGLATDAQAAAAIERLQFSKLFATKDAKEGMQAFLDKRDAQFVGE